MEPSTDRELLIRFDSKLDHLTDAIERLGDRLQSLEEKKIAAIQQELQDLKAWKSQLTGAYKFVMLFWVVATGLMVVIIKKIFGWN